MKGLAAALVLVATAAAAAPAEKDLAAALKVQADAWDDAIVRKDRAAIAANMSDTFQQIGSDGATADKAAFLEGITSDKLTIAPYTVEEFRVRLYGDAALITGRTDMHGTWAGKPFRSHYRFTDTYVREKDGHWRVANVQTTKVAEEEPAAPRPAGWRLGNLPWTEAEPLLTADRVVVLPLGAGSKEHGPHLLLKNDHILADAFADRVVAARPVAMLPTLTYGFYPAFLEYPGSVSLAHATQRDVVVEICRSLARYGPRRFYVLNTGVSTARPLKDAAALLAQEGILMRFSDLTVTGHASEQQVRTEAFGTHADEIETSMLLYLAPDTVHMDKAVKDGDKERPGPLTRDPRNAAGHYSPSGVFGDATLATREKGRVVVEGFVADVLAEIDALTKAPLPAGVPGSPLDAPAR